MVALDGYVEDEIGNWRRVGLMVKGGGFFRRFLGFLFAGDRGV